LAARETRSAIHLGQPRFREGVAERKDRNRGEHPQRQRRLACDLAEHLGREPETVHSTVHYGTSASDLKIITADRTIIGFQGKDITYSAEFTPEKIIINVNGEPMLEMDRRIRIGKIEPLQQSFQLVLNLALGGAWAGPIDVAALPATMTIKSIKVWEWLPSIGPEAAAILEE
jgi:hypothetical protein